MAKTIAIVEDDPDQRANYADAITMKGYKVSAYGSRQEALEGFDQASQLLRSQDVVLFDSGSRPEFGAVAEAFESGQTVVTEINDRETEVVGLFEMGTSFGIDGTIITSEDNWLRLFPSLPRSEIHLGLIRLQPGHDADQVRDALAEYLPDDQSNIVEFQAPRSPLFW